MTNVDRYSIETALAAGHVWAAMRNGRYWRLRRNGATKLWKTRPADFRIPIKAGIKSYGYIDQDSTVTAGVLSAGDFIITQEEPNIARASAKAQGVTL